MVHSFFDNFHFSSLSLRLGLIISFFTIYQIEVKAQTVLFEEPFDEAANSITGMDNVGGVTWNSTCPNSVAATDYFKVVGGVLEGRDTNGEAFFNTGNIDISSASYILIELEVSEIGTMEACNTGCTSVDWVGLWYSLDGGALQAPGNAFNCAGLCGGTAIYADDQTGTQSYSSDCINTGGANNLALQLSVSCWAGSEYWRIDNIKVTAFNDEASCLTVLPISLYEFTGEYSDNKNKLSWTTLSETNTNYYSIERSINGQEFEHIETVTVSENSIEQIKYEYSDYDIRENGIYYYQLKSYDFDGSEYDHGIRAIQVDLKNSITYNSSNKYILVSDKSKGISVYSIDGRIVSKTTKNQLYFDKRGTFIIIDNSTGDNLKIVNP